MTKSPLNPASVAGIYAVLATLWIWASDRVLFRLGLSIRDSFLFASIKGTFFVVATTLIIYFLLRCMVAQIRLATAEKSKFERQFQQAQKLEALHQLASNVAHDLKNHLMVISSYAELLGVADRKDIARRDAILTAVGKCDRLSHQLLAYSRRQNMNPIPVSVSPAISEIASMLGTVLGRGIKQELQLDSGASIMIDPGQLEQVLMNLTVNSKDAMPQGGRFRIASSDLKVESTLHGVAVPTGEYVQIIVSDTGEGIPDELRSRVFEPFFTTKARGRGTGLGLAAVYGIVKQSGGFVFVDSTVGEGTTFHLIFPKLITTYCEPVGAGQSIRES